MIEIVLLGLIALFCLILFCIFWYMQWRLRKIAETLSRMAERLGSSDGKEDK